VRVARPTAVRGTCRTSDTDAMSLSCIAIVLVHSGLCPQNVPVQKTSLLSLSAVGESGLVSIRVEVLPKCRGEPCAGKVRVTAERWPDDCKLNETHGSS
jgi:hypothetical protein